MLVVSGCLPFGVSLVGCELVMVVLVIVACGPFVLFVVC